VQACDAQANGFHLQLTTDRLLYPRKDAAYQLGVSVRTLDYLVARKELETRRIGKKVLITRRSLVRFANANHYEAVRGDAEQSEQAA
jgi:excisionase family DNA binding protein